jgi:polysaccharide deacetylase 2 family uncharacterized protein YibQ/stress-induced morphogen
VKKVKMTKKRGKRGKKRNSPMLFLAALIAAAVFIVILLEYIDFRKGKESFIFTKVIALETFSDKITRFNEHFLRVLNKNNIERSYHQDDQNRYHFSLQIEASRFDGLIARIETITGELKGKLELSEVQGMAGKSIMLYKVILDKKVSHWILITKLKKKIVKPPETKPKEEKKPKKTTAKTTRRWMHQNPRIAFIIDDVGSYDIGAMELKKLNIPVTASILPDSPHAYEEARWVRQYGLQVMIHLPMQPKNGNGQTYNRDKTITLYSSDDEIKGLVQRAKQIVPNAIGVNNHQGSLATANTGLMTRTLKIIREEGLFFVDSRTIGNTVAYDVAKRLGMRTTYKDVFLDHVKSYPHSINQIRRMVEIALQKGKAIAIGHPNTTTLRAIRDSIQYIRSRGVKIVYVSELLE